MIDKLPVVTPCAEVISMDDTILRLGSMTSGITGHFKCGV